MSSFKHPSNKGPQQYTATHFFFSFVLSFSNSQSLIAATSLLSRKRLIVIILSSPLLLGSSPPPRLLPFTFPDEAYVLYCTVMYISLPPSFPPTPHPTRQLGRILTGDMLVGLYTSYNIVLKARRLSFERRRRMMEWLTI